MQIIKWINDNKEYIATALPLLYIAIHVIVRLTKNKTDDEILEIIEDEVKKSKKGGV